MYSDLFRMHSDLFRMHSDLFRMHSDLFRTERNAKEVGPFEALTDSLNSIDVNFRTQSLNVSLGSALQEALLLHTRLLACSMWLL
jgi:hypothetical protein